MTDMQTVTTPDGDTPPDMTAQARHWQEVADRRLGMIAAISRIGAEPPAAVLAIIAGEELPPGAGSSDTSTIYYHSVDEFRRTLASSAEAWHRAKEHYFSLMPARARDKVAPEVRDAYAGTLMAYSYAYALAAVLGVAEREFGPQTARRLALVADDILTNGDFDDLNKDVAPGTPVPPPTPAEQTEAGQLTFGQEDPVTV